MSDRDRILGLLRDAGRQGVHSHDLRRLGYSGNPAQRIAELRDRGHTIFGKLERRNARNGKRWFLIRDAGRGVRNLSSANGAASIPSGAGVAAVTDHSPPEESATGVPGSGRDPGSAPGYEAASSRLGSARGKGAPAGGSRLADGAPGQPLAERLFNPAPLLPHDQEAG